MLPLGPPLRHLGVLAGREGLGAEQGEFVRSRVSTGEIIPPLRVPQQVFCLQTSTYQLPRPAGDGLPGC